MAAKINELSNYLRRNRGYSNSPYLHFYCTSLTGMYIFAKICQKVTEIVTWD